MPLRLSCPHCGHGIRLPEPYPQPGAPLVCTSCGRGMTVTYPPGVVERLTARGKHFDAPNTPPKAPAPPPPGPRPDFGPARPLTTGPIGHDDHEAGGDEAPTTIGRLPRLPRPEDPTTIAPLHRPTDALPTATSLPRPPSPDDPTVRGGLPAYETPIVTPLRVEPPASPTPPTPGPAERPRREWIEPTTEADAARKPVAPPRRDWVDPNPPIATPRAPKRRWTRILGGLLAAAVLLPLLAWGIIWQLYASELPSVEALRAYRPATVTTVHASDGSLLGEIYEERRYVLPLDEIPKHVQDAFVAAEDANFWKHDGIDYMGIARAMWRNAAAGRVSQGGSTITQQVAKVFLLTNDRKLERKIKEAFLSWRIEETYEKKHILFLYLNEIFLGSQAYGVEAAARTFFGKPIKEVTLGEAAILAGLPPRPSDYNPHASLDAALGRQRYVLDQMVRAGFITQTQADEARQEPIKIVTRTNTFREQAPHFTEYARRYLVEKYGEQRVLHEGLQVKTTCDPALQQVAQKAVTDGAREVDERLGFRREKLKNLPTAAEREAKILAIEEQLRKAWALEQDPAGRVEAPPKSVLVAGRVYDAVITEVSKRWARVRIGAHTAMIPMAWSTWVYPPDPSRSWKYRSQDDFTRPVDADGDGKKEGGILRVGDLVQVRVESLSTKDKAVASAFSGTPGTQNEQIAARLWQLPDVESALLSLDLETGAVRAMVGGADFSRSQFNRAVQSYRQVGSTFKPIVYGAAIKSKRLTAASIIPDAEFAITNEVTGETWKPMNYDNSFLGNITMRRALAMSRNVSMVRAADIIDPRMKQGVIASFARDLGIGGPPTHLLPADWVASPETDHLCPWLKESADRRSCPLRFPAIPESVTREQHKQALLNGAEHFCRECDLSLALGSASLTMEELVRAYAVFARGGQFVQPYYIEEVVDRDGTVLEKAGPPGNAQIMPPEVASVMVWLLQNVVDGGTAHPAKAALGLQYLAGKTGTTNDEKDAWFVGFTPDVITAVWVGYDQPRSLGASSTGGATALPIWTDYMKVAAPKDKDRPFPSWGNVQWAGIDEGSGMRVESGGRRYPFLPGTMPALAAATAGEATVQDLATEL